MVDITRYYSFIHKFIHVCDVNDEAGCVDVELGIQFGILVCFVWSYTKPAVVPEPFVQGVYVNLL